MKDWPADPAEERALEQAAANRATLLRVAGARRLAAQNVVVRAARYGLSTGADYPEMLRCLTDLEGGTDWFAPWAARARQWEELAGEAAGKGRWVTAADAYRRASACWNVAQIMLLDHDERKLEAHRRCVEAYRRAAPYLVPPAERLEAPFPGYFRSPAAGRGPAVILINGANTVKEELHHYTEDFLRRGFSTLVFDGPGHGERAARFGGPGLRVDDICAAVGAAVDYLAARPEVDPERIGVWGVSFGGFLALRCAAAEPRLRAAASLGGFYDLRQWPRLGAILHEEFRALLGLDTFAETGEYVRRHCSLRGHVEGLPIPYVVVHGGLDELLDVEEAHDMTRGPRGELWLIEDGVHGCYNRDTEVSPRLADWFVEQLG